MRYTAQILSAGRNVRPWIGDQRRFAASRRLSFRITFPSLSLYVLQFARALRFLPTSLQDSRILAVAYTSLSSSSGGTSFVRSTIYRFVPIKGETSASCLFLPLFSLTLVNTSNFVSISSLALAEVAKPW